MGMGSRMVVIRERGMSILWVWSFSFIRRCCRGIWMVVESCILFFNYVLYLDDYLNIEVENVVL